jgi:hypothetical protein
MIGTKGILLTIVTNNDSDRRNNGNESFPAK